MNNTIQYGIIANYYIEQIIDTGRLTRDGLHICKYVDTPLVKLYLLQEEIFPTAQLAYEGLLRCHRDAIASAQKKWGVK